MLEERSTNGFAIYKIIPNNSEVAKIEDSTGESASSLTSTPVDIPDPTPIDKKEYGIFFFF